MVLYEQVIGKALVAYSCSFVRLNTMREGVNLHTTLRAEVGTGLYSTKLFTNYH